MSIPGLWLFGEKDIQITVKLFAEYLDEFIAEGKPFDYIVFPSLGHNTISANTTEPVDFAIKWIKNTIIKFGKNWKNLEIKHVPITPYKMGYSLWLYFAYDYTLIKSD